MENDGPLSFEKDALKLLLIGIVGLVEKFIHSAPLGVGEGILATENSLTPINGEFRSGPRVDTQWWIRRLLQENESQSLVIARRRRAYLDRKRDRFPLPAPPQMQFQDIPDSRDHCQKFSTENEFVSLVRQSNLGDCKSVGEGVSELRVDYGPSYRVYFGQKGRSLVMLFRGDDKRR